MIEVLRLDGVSVASGGATLKKLNLCAYEGEVHGVIGEFGISHSDMARLLSLSLDWQSGRVCYNNRETKPLVPAEARARGIFPVSADCSLFTELSVLENIYITARRHFGWRFKKKEILPISAQYFDFFGLSLDVSVPLDELTALERTAVAVVGALIAGAKLIVFDGVSSTLGEQDSLTFKKLLSCLKYMGVTVICIVSRIDELTAFTDRATLLKNARTVRVMTREDYSYDNILAVLIM